jgi:DNA polymerase I-like protein with 3'-5' exonuclease and polymerase domains
MDGGAYAKLVCEGDVHTFNMNSAGLNSRDQAKTYIYALNYGAGDAKLGKIIQKGAKEGKKLREQTMASFPAYAKLIEKIGANVRTSNTLVGLDKRVLPVRAAYAALNTLLQSAGAILCKEWVSSCYEHLITKYRYGWDGDFVILGWIHDEIQVAVRKGLEQEVSALLVQLAREAGAPFGFRVPLDGASKTGPDWSCTH